MPLSSRKVVNSRKDLRDSMCRKLTFEIQIKPKVSSERDLEFDVSQRMLLTSCLGFCVS